MKSGEKRPKRERNKCRTQQHTKRKEKKKKRHNKAVESGRESGGRWTFKMQVQREREGGGVVSSLEDGLEVVQRLRQRLFAARAFECAGGRGSGSGSGSGRREVGL